MKRHSFHHLPVSPPPHSLSFPPRRSFLPVLGQGRGQQGSPKQGMLWGCKPWGAGEHTDARVEVRALSLPLSSAAKPPPPLPLTSQSCAPTRSKLPCAAALQLALKSLIQPKQKRGSACNAIISSSLQPLQGFICAHTTLRQAAVASSSQLPAWPPPASLGAPTAALAVPPAFLGVSCSTVPTPELEMVHFLQGLRGCRDLPTPTGLISPEGTHGSCREG